MPEPSSPASLVRPGTARSIAELRRFGRVDGHLDLAWAALARAANAPGRRSIDALDEPIDPTRESVSFNALALGGVRLALATIFTECGAPDDPGGYRDHADVTGARDAAIEQLELYDAWERAGRVRIIRTREDLIAHRDTGVAEPLGIVLLMEGADPIRDEADATWWYARGVRVVGLSWAYGSRYSGGNARTGGLTATGRALVDTLDALGMVHDLSHLADDSARELLARTSGPVCATHSNDRALMRGGERHLSTELAESIAAHDGVVGLNLFTRFLRPDDPGDATIDDVVTHANALAATLGRSRVGVGSDMDGGFGPDELPSGLRSPKDFAALESALIANGWSESESAGVTGGAWWSFLERALPAANDERVV